MRKLFYILTLFTFVLNAQDLPLLVNEEFNSKQGCFLDEYNYTTYSAHTENGLYKIRFENDSYWNNFQSNKYIGPDKDYIIEAKMKYVGGRNNYGFGISYGTYNYDNSNYFLISGNGYYNIRSEKKNEDFEHTNWISSSYVNQGDYNILRIEKTGEKHSFYLNGNLVLTLNDIQYYGNNFGISVQNQIDVDVDYFKIWAEDTPINLSPTDRMRVFKEFLDSNVNTKYMEKSPVISPDGNTMFFNRYRDNLATNSDDEIFYSEKDENGKWSLAKNIGSPLNNTGHNAVVSITADNNTMILMNTYNEDGSSKGGGLSISYKQNNKWTLPKDIIVEDFYNRSKNSEFMISADGQVLISTIERDDTYGLKDIYVSFKIDSTHFSKPLNLGADINTYSNEVGAILAPDMRTVYFSTDGYAGYGSHDLFMSRRIDDSWTKWTKPVNLGNSINSDDWDAYITLDASGEFAYMNSSRPGSDLDVIKFSLPLSLRPEPVCLIKGRIFDSKTNNTLDGDVEYKSLSTGKVLGNANSDDVSGIYKIILTRGVKYAFNASKEGYYPISQNIDLSDINDYQEITVDLPLTPIEKNAVILLNNLFFDYNKADLKEESNSELDQLILFLNNNPEVKIEILGHTDSDGSANYNLKLSSDRANEVMKYLVEKGIDKSRLKAKGMGETKPFLPNTSEENKLKNRRVEFIIK